MSKREGQPKIPENAPEAKKPKLCDETVNSQQLENVASQQSKFYFIFPHLKYLYILKYKMFNISLYLILLFNLSYFCYLYNRNVITDLLISV